MPSVRVIGGTAYIIASVIFLYWRLQVALHNVKCPRSSFAPDYGRAQSTRPIVEYVRPHSVENSSSSADTAGVPSAKAEGGSSLSEPTGEVVIRHPSPVEVEHSVGLTPASRHPGTLSCSLDHAQASSCPGEVASSLEPSLAKRNSISLEISQAEEPSCSHREYVPAATPSPSSIEAAPPVEKKSFSSDISPPEGLHLPSISVDEQIPPNLGMISADEPSSLSGRKSARLGEAQELLSEQNSPVPPPTFDVAVPEEQSSSTDQGSVQHSGTRECTGPQNSGTKSETFTSDSDFLATMGSIESPSELTPALPTEVYKTGQANDRTGGHDKDGQGWDSASAGPSTHAGSSLQGGSCHTTRPLQPSRVAPENSDEHLISAEQKGKVTDATDRSRDWVTDFFRHWGLSGTHWLLKVLEQSADAIEAALQESSDPAGLGFLDRSEASLSPPPPLSSSSASALAGSTSSPDSSPSLAYSFFLGTASKRPLPKGGQDREQAFALLASPLTVLSLLNTMAIFAFLLKEACLGTLSFMEAHRLVEMALGYVFVKLIFFVIVLDSIALDGVEWLILWVCFFGILKILERLAKERFHRLIASPSATVGHHARTLGLLLLVLTLGILSCTLVMPHFPSLDFAKVLLLMYEPAAVGLETLQTLVRYAFHLIEEFPQITAVVGKVAPFALFLSSGASGAEWRASVLHHSNAVFEVSCATLTLLHCLHLWQLHGFTFHIIDIVLFLNAKSLMGKLVKRARSFMRWRSTLKNLQSALPDASVDDITSFADDCAICKESMTAAKRLPCGHLFHLSCLRSWLDQGSAASHSCPSCRRPLRQGSEPTSPSSAPVTPTDQAPRLDADQPMQAAGAGGEVAAVGAVDAVRGGSWLTRHVMQWLLQLQARLEANLEGGAQARGARGVPPPPPAGPAVEAPGQAPRRVLQADSGAEVVRNGNVGLWGTGGNLRFRGGRETGAGPRWFWGGGGGQRPQGVRWTEGSQRGSRAPAETPEELESRLLAMAAQVEEILPHMPFNSILQDLRRTRSVMVTVNNLMDSW